VEAGALSDGDQPSLTTGDLLLRPWLAADAAAVRAAYDDPVIQRWHGERLTESEAAAYAETWQQLWRSERRAGWAVVREDVLVARVTLVRLDLPQGQAEVTYWVVPVARGGSVAPRAVGAVAAWCFDELGLHRLELAHSTQNAASCRVAEKAGFRLEGTKRRQGLHADGWHDMHLHALLHDD
jgi:RimJ/RimL family protein N-acetyltransferase